MALTKFSTRALILVGIFMLCYVNGAFSSGYSQCGKGESTLKAVSMLFRHGDRSPAVPYPLDPYRNYPWPGGYGALSPKGAEQLFTSGLAKSTRYSSLLSVNCDPNEANTVDLHKILVLSSSVQRCVDSVTNFLNGFIGVDWPSSLINVIPLLEDEMLAVPGKWCPKHIKTIITGPKLNDPEFKKIIDFESREGLELLVYLQKNTGLPIFWSTIITFLEDVLSVEKNNNLELPAWTDSVYEQYLVPLTLVVFDAWGSSEYMKIRSSALFKDITSRFDSLITGSAEQNILLYSAHDATIAGMLHFLGIRDQTVGKPAYGASLNLELHENSEIQDDYEVKLFYFTSYGDENPIEISIPNCATPCPYEQFKLNIQPSIVDDYDGACKLL
ncbi:unnamed protein product [Hermetia illucens]|uniref:Acid phosphatase n=1 Tax=Hermetia illucens TaxID=343691 RepID=A0A7R8YWJ1_HERIL|nr:lysosomal acid phosphatase-like isoform X3 [Hermetia illucens]CAD7084870.1 unnamed protein product [Hermetia illucens]